METRQLSKPAMDIIEGYIHFKIGEAICSVPYFNNKSAKKRASFRTYIGKGSPDDIHDEIETLLIKNHLKKDGLSNQDLKKFLIDNKIGIECSGFVYHVLEAESVARNLGHLNKKIFFINCKGIIGKLRCSIRPIENCGVETFASNENSRIIELQNVAPGDFITMTTSDSDNKDRNHILVIHEVQKENGQIAKIKYSHSIAYPEDGIYGTGIRQGVIEIDNIDLPITNAKWTESDLNKSTEPLLIRAKKSKTEIRRLNWF